MKIVFHGGASEVGKSCVEVQGANTRFLMDAGLKFKENGFEAPFDIFDFPKFDALFLSHAHLDHTGALPLFEHYNLVCPIFTTEQTREITKIMLKDSYKIARIKHLHPAYATDDLKKVYNAMKTVAFNKPNTFKDLSFKFINAGHIPGSAMILIKFDGKKLLYTGDFKMRSSLLMNGAEFDLDKNIATGDLNDIDVLICESTYGGKILPDREKVEEDFLNKVQEILKNGKVIIPVFALGRAQDILMLLSKRKWDVPIYYDGMAVELAKTILKYDSSYISNKPVLYDMLNKRVTIVSGMRQRENIVDNRGIFVTTSGMLQGGPVLGYVEHAWGNPNDAILMTGFQCKRTNGRMLLDEGFIYLNGWKTVVKCKVMKFDFSGHADDSELKEFITKINPKNLVIDHGDEENSNSLRMWAEKNTKSNVFLPKIGEVLEFK